MGVVLFQSSARVESLGTALASTTLQAKPAWARVRLNKFLNVYTLRLLLLAVLNLVNLALRYLNAKLSSR